MKASGDLGNLIDCVPVLGANGYFVNRKGCIFNNKGYQLKTKPNPKGYPCVSFHCNGKSVSMRVHRIVAVAFIPNPENKPCVNHKDSDRANFSIENLEWCTHSENVIHAVKAGRRKHIRQNNHGINNPRAKLSEHAIKAMRDLYEKCDYGQDQISKAFGLDQGRVAKIVKYKSWKFLSID